MADLERRGAGANLVTGRRELFYQTDDGAVSVNVDTTSEFTPGTPRPLFRLPAGSGIGYEFHIAPDGERFVLTAFDDEAAVLRERQLHVVLNWFEELERLFRRTRQHRSSQKESKKTLDRFRTTKWLALRSCLETALTNAASVMAALGSDILTFVSTQSVSDGLLLSQGA